jgi:hypothetical protein
LQRALCLGLQEASYKAYDQLQPETVSTDFDTSDRLYFESLTMKGHNVIEMSLPRAGHISCPSIVQFGGQTPLTPQNRWPQTVLPS